MTTLEYALKYLDNGYSIFPISKDKTPIVEWKQFQTRYPTVGEAEKWWAEGSGNLIGIVTGKISGISVVDVEKGGDSTIFPPTFTVRTGRGGIHLYYDYAEIGNLYRPYPLVDVRGDGGYVVAPPSVTSFIGKTGKLEGGEYTIIDNAPKTPFPIELFNDKQHAKFDIQALKGVTEGARNESAASVIGFLLAKTPRNEFQIAWNLAKAWNSQNKPPLEIEELKNVFESIAKRETGKVKEVEDEEVQIVPLKQAAEANKDDATARVSTGFDFLDQSSRGGIGPGELWVIAAPQGQGKTTLAMEMTLRLANAGHKSLWLSYELLEEELWQKFQEMGATDEFLAYTTLKRAKGDIGLIEKVITKAVEQEGVKAVFIDHFGRLSGKVEKYDSAMSSNFAVYLALMAERLKMLSLEKRVTIVLMAHTKKPQKGSKQTTSDIANTSGLGNEATMSILLEREIDDFKDDVDGDKYTEKLFVKIDKSRWGKEITKLMKFSKGRITDWDQIPKMVPDRKF